MNNLNPWFKSIYSTLLDYMARPFLFLVTRIGMMHISLFYCVNMMMRFGPHLDYWRHDLVLIWVRQMRFNAMHNVVFSSLSFWHVVVRLVSEIRLFVSSYLSCKVISVRPHFRASQRTLPGVILGALSARPKTCLNFMV